MRITPVIFNFALSNCKNNHIDYSQYRMPVLTSLERDTVTFGRANDKLEDVNPSRKPLEELYKYGLSCFCCGRTMIPPEDITSLKNSHVLNTKAPQAVKVLEKYRNSMHTVERDVFDTLKEESKKHPDYDFRQILQTLRPEHEAKLIKTQFGIFKLIEMASANINPEQKKQVRELIESEKEKILQGENKFRRKYFVNQFKEIFKDSKNTATKEHLIRLANKLPTSYENKSAFIVKYSSRNAEDIGIRLLSYSMCTIEHVTPQNKDGENHLFNYIPECMRCNSFRQDRPMIQQLEEHPEMFYNAQTLIDRLIDFANDGKLNKWYIVKIASRVSKESDNMLNLDISRLDMNSKMRRAVERKDVELDEDEQKLLKQLSYESTPKKTKKQKVKEKLKTLRKIKNQHKEKKTTKKR